MTPAPPPTLPSLADSQMLGVPRDSRYRRLDLLDALDNLMAEGTAMGIEQSGLCAGCRQVLHNAVDEREMQRLVRAEKEKKERLAAEKEAAKLAAAEAERAAVEAKAQEERAEMAEALKRKIRLQKQEEEAAAAAAAAAASV